MEAWDRADTRYMRTYQPWSLQAQVATVPDDYILGAPEAVFLNPPEAGSFGTGIPEQCVPTFRDPVRAHGIREGYRAAATVDVDHDHADLGAGRRIFCPTRTVQVRWHGGARDAAPGASHRRRPAREG